MNEQQQITLWLGATRYYVGRMTYAVSDFASLLVAEWPGLCEPARALIQRDVEAEFKRDDEARIEGLNYRPLGDDCDRAAWEKVRKLWG